MLRTQKKVALPWGKNQADAQGKTTHPIVPLSILILVSGMTRQLRLQRHMALQLVPFVRPAMEFRNTQQGIAGHLLMGGS